MKIYGYTLEKDLRICYYLNEKMIIKNWRLHMNIKECYDAAGGKYDEVIRRFLREELLIKFVLKFLSDKTFDTLITDLEKGDTEASFRGAHTLKGVAMNLGFTELYDVSAELTDMLRPLKPVDTTDVVAKLTASYNKVVGAIKEFQKSNS